GKPEGDRESIDSIENGRNAATSSPLSNRPSDIPLNNDGPSSIATPPIVHDLISPQRATSPLNSNQAQLLTKAQHKKKTKVSKKGGKNKKLKSGSELGGAAAKPKSHHLWPGKKRKKSFEVANGVEA
ncbi:unnamed protein product, partial [Rodentolepis nana]|uniref:SRP72 domain-containing protein n=1 Tax=Rodentolepis nana TaxID=102285 RepID=A0A0R3T5I6_RODNA